MKTNEEPIIVEQEIDKSVDIVWRALTDIIQMRQWYFDNIESFADEYQMNYPSFLANQHIPMYSAVFNNKSGALPFTAIIGPNRKIGYSHTGIVSLQTLREQVSKLL